MATASAVSGECSSQGSRLLRRRFGITSCIMQSLSRSLRWASQSTSKSAHTCICNKLVLLFLESPISSVWTHPTNSVGTTHQSNLFVAIRVNHGIKAQQECMGQYAALPRRASCLLCSKSGKSFCGCILHASCFGQAGAAAGTAMQAQEASCTTRFSGSSRRWWWVGISSFLFAFHVNLSN